MSPRNKPRRSSTADEILGPEDASLLDIVDNLLNRGVVLSGDITLALANVDLVYLRLSLLLSAADRVLAGEPTDFVDRRQARNELRARRRDATPIASARPASRRRSRA